MTGAPAPDRPRHDSGEPEAADVTGIGRMIRNLLDPYRPPADPYLRVATRIHARRGQRLAATALVGVAAAIMVIVAIAASGVLPPGGRTTVQPAGPTASISAEPARGPQFAQFGDRSTIGPAYVVASGAVDGRRYVVASVGFGIPGRTCLYADDAVFAQLSQCFTADPDQPGTWAPLDGVRSEAGVLVIGGVVRAGVRTVTVSTADRRKLPVRVVRTPTSPDMAFFVLALPGRPRITAVVARDGAGHSITVPSAGASSCPDTRDPGVGCATPAVAPPG